MGENGGCRACRQADGDAEKSHSQDFREIDGKDITGRCTQAFQRRDGAYAAINKGGHRVGNAGTADDERGQAHEREEIGEPVDKIFSPLGGPVARAQLPAGIGKLLSRSRDEIAGGLEALIIFKFHAVAIGNEAAGLDEAGCFQCIFAHQQARAQDEAIGNAVGLGGDDAAYGNVEGADLDGVAELYAEPPQQQGIGGHTIGAVLQGDCVLKRAVVFENDLAVKRIGSICCLDFNQCCCVGCYGHGAECRHLGDRAVAGNEVQFRCGLLRGG